MPSSLCNTLAMAHTPTVIITAAEAARRLGVSRERARQLLEQGTLAGFRMEGRARARYVDLEGEGGENDGVRAELLWSGGPHCGDVWG